ncbi:hypothetical protein H2200_002202 [Cladophialophora chaetospira]|uniref:HD/PDEase domain-containing protein n=1 Tax=Cladophialophora chaetospira TaxID=386627 RepID=A0AA38XJC1_9EURO|nr:hypothetical protein H2200_002202 [Cladophialophora chaetospira]
MASAQSFFPPLPITGITFPTSPLLESALAYTKEHTSPSIVNHCLRSAAFALLLAPRVESLGDEYIDLELVVYSCIMHDLGLGTTKAFLSPDKRFEVDSANLVRQFLREHDKAKWDKHRLQLSWDAIALHTTRSIAHYKEAEVALVQFGISADFAGPNFPPEGIISIAEYEEIATTFPRLGFKDQLTDIMCGLCRDKPHTTFDNIAGEYGRNFGIDGKGTGREEYTKQWAEGSLVRARVRPLEACEVIERSFSTSAT